MPNTLTNLIPTLIEGFDVVSREQQGFVSSVTRDPRADRVAKNQTLYSWAAPSATIADITPAATSPQAADQALSNKAITITNYKMSDFYFTAEEEYALGQNYGNIVSDKVEQAIRSLTNQMEIDLFNASYLGGSRAVGTAGTAPFALDISASAEVTRILNENGAPWVTRSLIVDGLAASKLRSLQQLTRANEAASTMTLRDGQILDLNGLSIKESGAVKAIAAGTGTGYQVSGATAAGATTITLKTGTGTVLAGDIITISGNSYVVVTGVAAPGSITIAAPGLRAAAADNTAVAVVAASTRNVGFSRNAIILATRLPALPAGGDMAEDRQTITDSRSGISLEVALYRQYRQVRYEISAAWGVTVIKPEHIAILMG
jgi:hypothetical protein